MADNFVLGKDCKFYRASAVLDGDSVTPALASWTEIDNVKDLTLNLETGETDISTRATGGWVATAATLKNGSISFQMLWLPEDAGFAALQTAWEDSAEIGLMALDGDKDVSGSQGLASNFTVTNFSRSEPLTEAVMVDVTVKPSSQPEWYESAGS
ncbi:MAG TPA: phage tail tube protein [Vicinamibacterales bacterium]|nr:phage tail tube protein [Vicinamibacterales bacterium]